MIADVLVVGSGPSGITAAGRLLELGREVTLMDASLPEDRYPHDVPARPFLSLRHEDREQHRYILGDDYEGVALGATGPLAQATPPRQHVFRRAKELFPAAADGFAAIESLAAGGLGEAWGAVSFPYTRHECEMSGLDADRLAPHYDAVARQIGLSGEMNDDLTPWRGSVRPLQGPPAPDRNACAVLAAYQRRRDSFHARGLRLGRPLLAMLTESIGSRQPNPGYGLDFWANHGGSVFRPTVVLDELRQRPGLTYQPGMLVLRWVDQGEQGVEVEAVDLTTGEMVTCRARTVLLAAGALGTTRIVLRSLSHYDRPVPLVCNEHALIPTVRLGGLGDGPEQGVHALAQLTAMIDPTGDQRHLAQAQFYSVTGLPLARLLRESPCAYRDAIAVFRTIATSLVILVLQHEDHPEPTKTCLLRQAASLRDDPLEFDYRTTTAEADRQRAAEGMLKREVRRLGCWPVRSVYPGAGSSIHYGGMLPYSSEPRPLTTGLDGRLHGTANVYVGDGASLRYLPAKGLTLTLMANAHRVADGLAPGSGRVRVA